MTNDGGQTALKACLAHIEVQGFRSLRDISLDLPLLTVMIGANGAGKSNLIRFFEMLSWMLKSRNLAGFVEKWGGGDDQLFMGAKVTPVMRAQLRIDSGQGFNDYRFGLAHATGRDRLIFVDEAFRYSQHGRGTEASWIELDGGGGEARLPEIAGDSQTQLGQRRTASTLVHMLRECSTYQFHDTSDTAPIKTRWDVADHQRLRSHGGNLAAVLLHLREQHFKRYDLIERQIRRVLPSFGGFDLEPTSGKVLLQWRSRQGNKVFGAHLTSDGSLRLFCLITLLSLPDDMLSDVILIDEPELGLHPAAITLIAEMAESASETHQIVLSTQSPYLVDCFDLDSIVVADFDDAGATQLRRLDAADYREWLEDGYSLSDIWLQNVIGGRP